MSLLDSYMDRDVVKHFVSLIADSSGSPFNIGVTGGDLWETINNYELTGLLPRNVKLFSENDYNLQLTDQHFIDRIIAFAKTEKAIVTIKEAYLNIHGSESTLQEVKEKGADIRVVDDILGAMVVASKKRRNKVVYPITGYEDEALITAAGLAKTKTVGFRNFFVLNGHKSLVGIINSPAKTKTDTAGFIIPLKVGINTGITPFSDIPLLYNKGIVFSGYEPAEIMQSIWMIVSQQTDNKPAVVYQRTKEVSDEVINRSRWMLEEVFEHGPLESERLENIPAGLLVIKEKYSAFDLKE